MDAFLELLYCLYLFDRPKDLMTAFGGGGMSNGEGGTADLMMIYNMGFSGMTKSKNCRKG